MNAIAYIQSHFPTKFGIPRQSGLLNELTSKIIFHPPYRNPDALRGMEEFSHLWIIWEFSENKNKEWSPTVRPPKLGGNKRVGVFATRSPFRPNPIGLSCVKLEKIEYTASSGPVIYIKGADLMDGTPIYDIKPYLSYCDSHPDAVCGFAPEPSDTFRDVVIPDNLLNKLPEKLRSSLIEILKNDPRPGYKTDTALSFGFEFAGYEISFMGESGKITVTDINKISD